MTMNNGLTVVLAVGVAAVALTLVFGALDRALDGWIERRRRRRALDAEVDRHFAKRDGGRP